MSRRTQPVIEEFDDDTDLPLPSRPLPNTGSKGALLQSVDSDSEDDSEEYNVHRAPSNPFNPGPASPSQLGQFNIPPQMRGEGQNLISDLTPYKKWTCIYPIYIDAKRPLGPGCRRIARAKAVWWPLSKDIADAATRLGLGTLHEVQKCHPRDWENPGRVRVQWKRDGRIVNERIKTKKQLLEAISFYIQSVKPELIPKPPFSNTSNLAPASSEAPSSLAAGGGSKPIPTATSKPKQQPAKSKGKNKAEKLRKQEQAHKPRLPQPPEPIPPLANRLSSYSPALPSGVLVDTVKAGMSAAAADNAIGGPAGGGKGKRKVVRVRG